MTARRSAWRSVGGWIGLLVCLALAGAVTLARPDLTEDRFGITGIDQDGWGRTVAFDARVDEVRVGTEIVPYDGAEPVTTGHRWVVVRYTVASHRDRLWAGGLALITGDGRVHHPRTEFGSLALVPVDAGFTATATVVFEVPEDAPAGATVRIGPLHTNRRTWDVAVRVDVDTAAGRDAPILLDQPTVEVTR